MRKPWVAVLLSCLVITSCSPPAPAPAIDVNALSAPIKNRKKSKIMILGTFHFKDGGYDSYKPRFSVNIKSPERQAEVEALVQLLAEFKPTKVAIESKAERQAFHDSLYHAYRQQQYMLGENEIYQVCYRLAAAMGHEKLYTIDAPARGFDEEINLDSFAQAHQQHYADTVYGKLLFELYAKDDSLASVHPLRTTLAYQNNPDRLMLGLGHYLIGDFKASADGLYPGPDGSTYWWNRNLRIFANILKLAATSSEERVFVLIGAGHLQILRLLALACPEIEFVDVFELLKENGRN